MNDFERFEELINNGAGCISIVTYEEGYALDIARSAAMGLGRDFWTERICSCNDRLGEPVAGCGKGIRQAF